MQIRHCKCKSRFNLPAHLGQCWVRYSPRSPGVSFPALLIRLLSRMFFCIQWLGPSNAVAVPHIMNRKTGHQKWVRSECLSRIFHSFQLTRIRASSKHFCKTGLRPSDAIDGCEISQNSLFEGESGAFFTIHVCAFLANSGLPEFGQNADCPER